MTIPIFAANISAGKIVTGLSRYSSSQVIYYGENNIITFETYIRKPYRSTGQEHLMVITPGVEYRPDLVAYDKYGSPNPWWYILQVNGMIDIWEFKSGTTIMLPNLS